MPESDPKFELTAKGVLIGFWVDSHPGVTVEQAASEVEDLILTAVCEEAEAFLPRIRARLDRAKHVMAAALRELMEPRGAYSRDELTHARNTVRWVTETADRALANAGRVLRGEEPEEGAL